MKTIPPPCPEPEVGPTYWRSLDQLAEAPEFRDWMQREFPAGASELPNDFSRRDFVKLMSASFLLAGVGLTGCRKPEEHIYPFGKMPEDYVHGVPQHYATAMPTRGGAVPLVVKSHEGRPVKVEGNPQHPDSNGGTDVFAQASILGLYDPDRATRYCKSGAGIPKKQAVEALAAAAAEVLATRGARLALLLDHSTSPTRARMIEMITRRYPGAKVYTYEPLDPTLGQQAASIAFGTQGTLYHRVDRAKVILSLDCDFLGVEEDPHRSIRGFAKGRKISKPGDKINRLYAVEGLMTLTGANADHRLRVAPGLIGRVAVQIALEVLKEAGGADAGLVRALEAAAGGAIPGVNAAWIKGCAKDLAANRGSAVVMAGQRQPLAVHLIALAINAAIGSVGSVVEVRAAPPLLGGSISELVQSLNAGQVGTLAIVGGNPAYNAPVELGWSTAVGKANSVFRLGYYEDESFSGATYHFPATHFLESWGDARTSDGTIVPVQPLVQPMFEGMTDIEFLATLAGYASTAPYNLVRDTMKGLSGGGVFDEVWKKFLHDGYLPGTASAAASVSFNPASVVPHLADFQGAAPSVSSLDVVFARDYSVDDGRYANNGWLQELPDPVTKITWDNAILMSRKTARELQVENTNVVSVEVDGRKLTGPVWIQPGMADYTLGLQLGYGRSKAGRIAGFGGKAVGYNAYALRTAKSAHLARGAKAAKTGGTHPISCTQDHWSMEGRPIVREANLAQYESKPGFAKNMDLEAHAAHIPVDKNGHPGMIYKHPYVASPALKSDVHQWGMSIDLSTCVGCSACVIACQSENNIPIVGKDQVAKGREMHWLRIDRYYAGDLKLRALHRDTATDEAQQLQEWIDDPQVVNQPMMCQHCENAPCESVCPVNATVHDAEGLNVMAYNRCVGTRYCSNNCAYKVRRFNFFDYNKRPIENLYKGPLATRPKDEWELTKLAKNPDVSVRMRGVMEKCTFCVQRIEQAKIAQKVLAGPSDAVRVPRDSIKTACQQACPAEAIVFGNLLDPESEVSKLKQQQRDYSVLGFLDNRPRLTYLAKIRNPNPSMPDYYEYPLSLKEYSDHMGSPFESHHPSGGDAAKGGH